MQTQALICTLDMNQTKVFYANHQEHSQLLSHCHYGLTEDYRMPTFLSAKTLNQKWY